MESQAKAWSIVSVALVTYVLHIVFIRVVGRFYLMNKVKSTTKRLIDEGDDSDISTMMDINVKRGVKYHATGFLSWIMLYTAFFGGPELLSRAMKLGEPFLYFIKCFVVFFTLVTLSDSISFIVISNRRLCFREFKTMFKIVCLSKDDIRNIVIPPWYSREYDFLYIHAKAKGYQTCAYGNSAKIRDVLNKYRYLHSLA